MQKIGDKLDEARSAWISGSRKLSSGRGNLINRIQVLKDLGAESSKEIQEIDLKEEKLIIGLVYWGYEENRSSAFYHS
jgi:DNA recombination protein RmuC